MIGSFHWGVPVQVYKLLIILVLLCAMPGIASAAGTRGISVNIKASEDPDAPIVDSIELYAKSYALVIGIDEYSNGWPKLSNAVQDAELISAELEKKGFDVEMHTNLNSDELNTVFKRFFILKGDDPNARLFIWFAGHGATVDGEGYLIPADAPTPQQGAEFKFASVALRDFGTFMRQAVSKHAYAVFDSCFAGTVFSAQRALPPAAITRATTMPVRQFLTSGDADQTVSDDGAFRELFIRAINGDERSDANGDGYVTASELGMFLGDRVTNLTQSLQTPRYGKLRDRNFDRGDFVFTLPEGAVASALNTVPSASAPDSAELVFWDSIKTSKNPGEFDAYLKQYPNGAFATLAKLKKKQLSASQTADNTGRSREKFQVTFVDQDLEAIKVANVRQTPFPNAPRVARLEAGARVWAVGQTKTRGGIWYKIARDGHELGFVYGPLLASIGRMDRVVAVEPLPFKPEPAYSTAQSSLGDLMDEVIATSVTSEDEVDNKLASMLDSILEDVPAPDLAGDTRPALAAGPAVDTTATRQRVTRGLVQEETPQNLPDTQLPAANTALTTDAQLAVQTSPETIQLPAQQTGLEAADSSNQLDNLDTGIDKLDLTQTEGAADTDEASLSEPVVSILTTTGSDQVMDTFPAPVTDTEIQAEVTAAPAETNGSETTITTDTIRPTLDADPVVRAEAAETIQLANVQPAYSDYVKRYIEVANQGNAKAQLSLGYMFETGQQVAVDKKEAAKWYLQAAQGGEVQAMISLGLLYEAGEGVVASQSEAAYWYRKAAELGNADAQQTIGFMYEQGNGITKDPAEAARWYEKAAKQGRMTAQNNLGRLYQLGIGVPQDMDKAILWYEKAAAQGSEAAAKNLDELLPGRGI